MKIPGKSALLLVRVVVVFQVQHGSNTEDMAYKKKTFIEERPACACPLTERGGRVADSFWIRERTIFETACGSTGGKPVDVVTSAGSCACAANSPSWAASPRWDF